MGTFPFYYILTISIFLGNIATWLVPRKYTSLDTVINLQNNSTYANAINACPPGAWLGHGLDMTAIMPLDIIAVRYPRRILNLAVLTR